MTCLMSQMISRQKYVSNELSWAQCGVEEDLQKLNLTTLFILAASFYKFWPILGDWTFDKENELQIEKLKMFWKLDSTRFPTSYPMLNLGTGKAFQSGPRKCSELLRRVLRFWVRTWQRFSMQIYTSTVILEWHYAPMLGVVFLPSQAQTILKLLIHLKTFIFSLLQLSSSIISYVLGFCLPSLVFCILKSKTLASRVKP